MTWTQRTRRTATDEQGIAILSVLVILLLVAGAMTILYTVTTNSLDHSKRRLQRVVGLAPADQAISQYLGALQRGSVSEATWYKLSGAAMTAIAAADTASGMQVLANTNTRVAAEYRTVQGAFVNGHSDRLPTQAPNSNATMRAPLNTADLNGQWGYWQVYRVDEPAANTVGNLVVHFRAWVANRDGTNATRARMIRVEYRPGYFSSYLILTDGIISFAPKARIDGKVHSNGLAGDEITEPPLTHDDWKIWYDGVADDAPVCSVEAHLETPNPTIHVGNTGCPASMKDHNSSLIDIQGAKTVFDRMKADCPLGTTTFCPEAPEKSGDPGDPGDPGYMPQTAYYEVWMDPDQNKIHYTGWDEQRRWVTISTTPVPTQADGDAARVPDSAQVHLPPVPMGTAMAALLFDRSIYLSGNNNGRVAIAARNGEGADSSAATITLTNDGVHLDASIADSVPHQWRFGSYCTEAVGEGTMPYGLCPSNPLGVIAEGDVIVDIDHPRVHDGRERCSLGEVRGAFTAVTGRLKIAQVLSPVSDAGSDCGDAMITVKGSITGHFAPVLKWDWDSGANAGYKVRRYSYDKALVSTPPPYYPRLGAWEEVRWSDANVDCLTATGGGTCE